MRAAARERLRDAGPASLADLADFLVREGHEIARDLQVLEDHLLPDEFVEWEPAELHDGRLVDEEAVLDGLVLTTRLTDEAVASGAPTFSPDLDPLALLMYRGQSMPLASGGELGIELDGHPGDWVIEGPPGWMPGAVGQVLVVRLDGGMLHVDAVDASELATDPDLVDRLAETYAAVLENGFECELGQLVVEVKARHPSSWDHPGMPLGELVAASDLALHGDWVVYPDELDEDGNLIGAGDALDDLADHLVHDHGMTDDQAGEVVLLRVLATGLLIDPPPNLDEWERGVVNVARVLAGEGPVESNTAAEGEFLDLDQGMDRIAQIFADDEVVQGVAHDLMADVPALAGPLAVLTRRVGRASRDRVARSNAWWVHGQALEFLDEDGITTERALRQALEASDDHVGAAADLAWHLDDRGQPGAALGVLTEHGMDDTLWAEDLRGWARPGPAAAGRNEVCPCGSQRKHKACCGPRNGWPLIDRMDWVWGKLTRFAARPANVPVCGVLAVIAGMDPLTVRGLPEEPVVASLCLFEGGIIGDMCRLRGPLLPADELELLRQWEEEVAAGVYEVVASDPGQATILLDLRTGERHEVTDRSASQQLEPGTVMLTWLVPYPDGTTRMALGATQVAVPHRAGLLGLLDGVPEAEDLASWYAALHAPPRLHNTDGDPLMVCEVTVAVPDIDAAVSALAASPDLEAEDDQEAVFVRLRGDDDGQTLVGTVRVAEDGMLDLEANSSRRIDQLVDVVLGAVTGSEVVDDVRTPMGDLLHGQAGDAGGLELELGPELPSGALDLDALDDFDGREAAAMRVALDQWMQNAEERWCDEPIPALGGMTPRDAALDPTRRADLVALLDEMPRPGPESAGVRGFDPDRLRRLLGLR